MKKNFIIKRKKRKLFQQLLNNRPSPTSYILMRLSEEKQFFVDSFLDDLPSTYPSIKILKEILGRKNRRHQKEQKNKKNKIVISLYRLKREGLIRKLPDKKVYTLTKTGKEVADYIYERYSILDQSWDGKIRIVVFDIPEKKRGYRDWLRKELLLLDFKPLQKSVYVGFNPIPESFYYDINEFGLQKYLFLFTAKDIDKEERILDLLKEK